MLWTVDNCIDIVRIKEQGFTSNNDKRELVLEIENMIKKLLKFIVNLVGT